MQQLIFHLLRSCLGVVFLASGTVKIRGTEEFAYTVRLVIQSWFEIFGIQISTNSSALWSGLAITLIVVELSIGAALLLNLRTKMTALLSAIMLTVFTGALLILMHIGHSCGCFGASDGAVSGAEIFRNAVLIGCSLAIWLMASRMTTSNTQQMNTDIELSNDVHVFTARADDLR